MANERSTEFYIVTTPRRFRDEDRYFAPDLAGSDGPRWALTECSTCGTQPTMPNPVPIELPAESELWGCIGTSLAPKWLPEAEWERCTGLLRQEWERSGRHVLPIGSGARVGPLRLKIGYRRIRHFYRSWNYTIVSEQALRLFEGASISGYDAYPVEVVRTRAAKGADPLPQYFELVVWGQGGRLDERSEHVEVDKCAVCGWPQRRFYKGLHVNRDEWDGSDFFHLSDGPFWLFITDRVKALLDGNGWLDYHTVALASAVSLWPPREMGEPLPPIRYASEE